MIEGDTLVISQLGLDQNETETMEHIIRQMENERGLDRSAAIADMRYSFIQKVCDETVTKPRESRERLRSEKIDRYRENFLRKTRKELTDFQFPLTIFISTTRKTLLTKTL